MHVNTSLYSITERNFVYQIGPSKKNRNCVMYFR